MENALDEQQSHQTDDTLKLLSPGADTEFDTRSHHNSAQPFLKLPTEILSSILLLASSRRDDTDYPMLLKDPDGDEDSYLSEALPSRSFISLNLLCKRVRQVALESPRCWSDVLVIIKNNQVINAPTALEDRLNRSKEVPMHLFFYTPYPDSLNNPQESAFFTKDQVVNPQTLKLLGAHTHRCQHITFYTPYAYLIYHPIHISKILQSFSWNFPSLRRLTVLDYSHFDEDLPYSFDWHQFSPHIDQTTISCVELMFCVFSGEVATTGGLLAPRGVTRLRLERGYDPHQVIEFMRQTTHLQHLDWDACNPHEAPGLWSEDSGENKTLLTVLPDLLSLRLRTEARHPGYFRLVAPKCEELYLHEVRYLWDEMPPAFERYWGNLTLPRLQCFSISRPTSYGNASNDEIWAAVRRFLDRHLTLQEVFVYAPLRYDSQDLTWNWILDYLTASPEPQQSMPSTSDPNYHPHMSSHSNMTSSYPLPNLRNLWLEIDRKPWSSDFWQELIASVDAVLLSRPYLTIHLWPLDSPLNSPGRNDGGEAEGRRTIFPPNLEALAGFRPVDEGVSLGGASGRLELLSSPRSVKWPKAWGFLHPDTG
ncbi:hypothetical protein DL93DRAFT_2167440 [Clavulina sp. PMI_390]|nr:hypothetical protein DL93DRAFT_2167440 [Clavulina sp. PMI_390]